MFAKGSGPNVEAKLVILGTRVHDVDRLFDHLADRRDVLVGS